MKPEDKGPETPAPRMKPDREILKPERECAWLSDQLCWSVRAGDVPVFNARTKPTGAISHCRVSGDSGTSSRDKVPHSSCQGTRLFSWKKTQALSSPRPSDVCVCVGGGGSASLEAE